MSDEEPHLRIRRNGPYVVTGRVPVRREAGPPLEGRRPEKGNMALCRCGASADKPFCDGTHMGAAWPAEEHAKLDDADGDTATSGPAEILVVDDGPLVVRGGMPLRLSDGTDFGRLHEVELCRCGASESKPLCDRSHVDIGFCDPR